ncbi:hypothetical protein KW062_12805 [Pseudomonas fluorescens]|nr:hypothetical protein KW062_12805 [Pseudomonas fluorescens]
MRLAAPGISTFSSSSMARLRAGAAGHFQVQAQHFLDLETDGVARIQCRHRVLEDHGQVLADDLAALAVAQLEHVLAVEAQGVGR